VIINLTLEEVRTLTGRLEVVYSYDGVTGSPSILAIPTATVPRTI